MPLRDHFRPPVDDVMSWEGFHGQWPAMIVTALVRKLPRRYVAAPRIHFGSSVEIVANYEKDEPGPSPWGEGEGDGAGVATAETATPQKRTAPGPPRAFAPKGAALLQEQVSAPAAALVRPRQFNLY